MTSSLPNSRSNRAKVDRAAQDLADEKIIIQSLMAHPAGRRWIWKQLEWARVFLPCEDVSSHAIMAWNEGRRNSGLRLYTSVLAHAPSQWPIAVNESSTTASILNQEDDSDDNLPD